MAVSHSYPIPRSKLSGPDAHILIVDDDASIRLLLSTFFEKIGYLVSVASNGTEALRTFREASTNPLSDSIDDAPPARDIESPIDLVLLDMRMPDMNGLQVCNELRQDSDVPVIVLSGTAEDPDLLTTAGLTSNDFIQKPFSVREVEARVKSVLCRDLY